MFDLLVLEVSGDYDSMVLEFNVWVFVVYICKVIDDVEEVD